MAGQFDSGPNRYAGSLFASALVLFVGAVGGAGLFAAAGGDPLAALLVAGSGLGLLPLLAWLARSSGGTSAAAYKWVFSREARPPQEYTPTRRRSTARHCGTNQPPTVDEVRELKEGLRNWVPSNTPGRRRSVRTDD